MTTQNSAMSDEELQQFIEKWIPINVRDAQHVKEAKIAARAEFLGIIKARDQQITLAAQEQLVYELVLKAKDGNYYYKVPEHENASGTRFATDTVVLLSDIKAALKKARNKEK